MPVPGSSAGGDLIFVAASSDGAVRLWFVKGGSIAAAERKGVPTQVGRLVGVQESGSRITCLGAFAMDGVQGNEKVDSDDGVDEKEGEEESESDDE